MPDSPGLLADLRRLLAQLEADLRGRADTLEEVGAALRAEYAEARRVGRTADAYEVWREEPITQAAVAWTLGTVFVRFLEDTALIEPWLSGPAERRRRALDRHTLYFQQHPAESDREYLQHVFRTVAGLPAARDLFDPRHNPLWQLPISGDAAKALLEFWQRIDPATGEIAHAFADPSWDTRFLGDLYQDLSEPARQRYALLQTPRFVEAFILDRTLTPAIAAFGYREVRLIDPTCGSGHFLLGAFAHLLALAQRHEPGTNTRALVQRVLGQVAGVDLNPFAAAIARFRLLVAALQASEVTRLADAPAFQIDVAVGDSLLHGRRFVEDGAVQMPLDPDDPARHHFRVEDPEAIDRILGRQYHAVVGNPPYITVKDRALNQLYRQRFGSCHMKYSLVVPFMERFFELAQAGFRSQDSGFREGQDTRDVEAAGFVGMIVANSFMKREFGKKLIETYLPRWDLTHVVDTSGAYIPGHGTPTVILFGRHRPPTGRTRTVMGIRGEPATPDDPARGQVWSAILGQIDVVDSESAFVSVRDLEQTSFHSHPWSIGGGGAAELKELLDERGEKTLGELADAIGITSVTGEDDLYLLDQASARRLGIERAKRCVLGDAIRDWQVTDGPTGLWLYDDAFELLPLATVPRTARLLWTAKAAIRRRRRFGTPMLERGLTWYEWQELYADKLRTPLSIAFAFVATHNHFVLDRGGKVFNRSAPVIKLPPDATEDDHLALLGLLNSSAACFWMKQVSQNRGSTIDERGARQRTAPFEDFWELSGGLLAAFPLPGQKPLSLVRRLDAGARAVTGARPVSSLRRSEDRPRVLQGMHTAASVHAHLEEARRRTGDGLAALRVLQEELDWSVYHAYGLTQEPLTYPGEPPPLNLGERAFEIVMARRMAAGEMETTWFERHGSTPITELPSHWSQDYKRLVEQRIRIIETDRNIGVIERPEHKRRWNTEPWEAQQGRALRTRLLERLETDRYWPSPAALETTGRLADVARQDAELMAVAEVYRGRADFDVTSLVTELVMMEAVPFLPVVRYTEIGLRKRALWERTWALQRAEDAIDARVELPEGHPEKLTPAQAASLKATEVGVIPVPPKYTSADYRKGDYWRLRGKLDVPKERFIAYPGAERVADATPVVAWAGWDHLQQAQALSAYYVRMQEQEGWAADRLAPLLAGLLELVPWLRQWHNAVDPAYGQGLGDYFAGFVDEEARRLGLTLDALRSWRPAAPPARRGKK